MRLTELTLNDKELNVLWNALLCYYQAGANGCTFYELYNKVNSLVEETR